MSLDESTYDVLVEMRHCVDCNERPSIELLAKWVEMIEEDE